MVIGRTGALGTVTETGIVAPTRACNCRRVLVPSAISWLLRGSRPVAGGRTKDMSLGTVGTITSNSVRPARNRAPVQPVAHAATCRSRLTVATTGPVPVPALLVTAASQVTPYRAGEASRWLRLAANTIAALTAAAPTAAPATALRTGTAVRPAPRCRASRGPMASGTGPVAASREMTGRRPCRPGPASPPTGR